MKGSQRKYSDLKGHMDRGPKEMGSHIAEKSSELLRVASHKVISVNPSTTIKQVATIMDDQDVRRLPVIDAGSQKLKGIVTAMDILDFMGGGPKYNIIDQDYEGNFLKAVNCQVSKIMRQSQYLKRDDPLEMAAKIMVDKRSSCIPIVESEQEKIVVGIITEHDILPQGTDFGVTVSSIMNPKPITASEGMMMSDVSKVMVRNQIRRLPVIKEDSIVGMVTVFDILRYLEEGEYKGVNAEENLSTRVSELMESHVISLDPKDDVSKASQLIRNTGKGGFPVVKGDSVKGILTATDILRWVYATAESR